MSNIFCAYDCGEEVHDLTCDACKAKLKPTVRIPPGAVGQPLTIWGLCKKAALKADWPLRRWEEFKDTANACLRPECEPEELQLFMRVVQERFEIT